MKNYKLVLGLGVVLAFGACNSLDSQDAIPETQEDLAGVGDTPVPAKAPKPDPTPEIDPEPKPDPVELGESMYELGRETERIYQELDPMAKTVVFMDCLEEQTGKDVRGPDIERHIKRNSKESQACRKKLVAMSDDDIRQYAMKRVEDAKATPK